MATIEICDVCGSSNAVNHMFFCTGRSLDAAGSIDDDGDGFDLCNSCELKVLKRSARRFFRSSHIESTEYDFNKICIAMVNELKNIKP